MTEAETTTTESTTTEAPAAAPPPAAAPAPEKLSRAERIARQSERFDNETGDEDDAPAPIAAKSAPAKGAPATPEPPPAPPPPVRADIPDERIARIEALARAQEESSREKIAAKRAHNEATQAKAQADAALKDAQAKLAILEDPKRLLAHVRSKAKSDAEVAQWWMEINNPDALSRMHAQDAAQAVESKALAEIQALKAQLEQERQSIAEQQAVQSQVQELITTLDANKTVIPNVARYQAEFGMGAYIDACDRLALDLSRSGKPVNTSSVLLEFEETAKRLFRSGTLAPPPVTPNSTTTGTTNGNANGQRAPSGPTLTNAAASDGASSAVRKMTRKERLAAQRARFR